MNDNDQSTFKEAEKSSWDTATGKWMVDQLQLAQPESTTTSFGLAPEEVGQLQEIAKSGATRFYFPKKLEQRFQQEQRQQNRAQRLTVAALTMICFALEPLLSYWLVTIPDGAKSLELWLCFGVIVPAFAIATFLQFYFVASELAEASLLLAICAEVAVIEILRLHATTLGIYIVPTITASVAITAFALIGLTFRRRTTLFIGYFAIIWFTDAYFSEFNAQRDVSVWINEFIVLTLVWVASAFNRINVRRAWAANILLEISANQDSLTGLSNRSAFETHYEQQMRLGRRYGKSSVLALIDLDHFKQVNDYYGHPYGDAVLIKVGLLLNDCARRPGDFAARIGGEEFALFLYDCTAEGARSHLDAMVQAVQALGLEHVKSKVGFVTISVGAVLLPAESALSKAYQLADINLYNAKGAGRNQLVVSELS
ncbi:GGDEF domain-containing protein [Stenotrophobium rhamnosiphilum]|uniref:diguanylate cyclase n=1 Tax=Stenotrophobium rhamnosiphilum TaxID=2029166 RepID=A0A2T5MH15_9GAMM|nr:GGDEF domain-containing protein [Stenotrophobium rhamnosiphilum]PTU31866.1 hypothetical protein CJD38_04050 [Stenotrophobium rhamnosiphilum]